MCVADARDVCGPIGLNFHLFVLMHVTPHGMVVYEGVCHVFARAPAPLNGCSGAENMYRVLCVAYC